MNWIQRRRGALTFRNLMDLATSELPTPQDHIKQIYVWRHERAVSAARSLAGAGLAIGLAMIAAMLRKDSEISNLQLNLGWSGSVFLIGVGAWRYYIAGLIQQEYLAALKMASEIQTMKQFLLVYLESR